MDTPLTQNILPGRPPLSLAEYERAGGYQALRKALTSLTPAQTVQAVKDSQLRGRGGAGFPTGLKWSFLPPLDQAPQPRYLVVNADELEPGTFKDRFLLEGDPHQMIEGILISAYALQAESAYLFIRWAYKLATERMERAIAEARAAGYLGKNILGSPFSLEIHLHTSAGRYMCGEETGLLNALEGKRANPRSKPPFPPAVGLWGRPSNVNNVETLCNVPHIVNRGADWFRGLSKSADAGTKLYGVSGRVNRPGLWELPMGVTTRDLLERAGGMRGKAQLRGFLPGGASTDFLTADHLDVPLDYASMVQAGSRLGTGILMVMDDGVCPVGAVRNLMQFFARESCGWCTPCREGLPWIEQILASLEAGRGRPEDLELLEEQAKWLGPGTTFCALAPGAAAPLASALRHFRTDFERHVQEKRCPWKT